MKAHTRSSALSATSRTGIWSLVGALLLASCDATALPQAQTPAQTSQTPSAAQTAGPSTPTGPGQVTQGTQGTQGAQGAQRGSDVAGARVAPNSRTGATAVYQQAGPSVVNITSLAVVRMQGIGAQQSQQQTQPRGTGSGFIIDTQGHIITNNHVVEDADQLSVTFQNNTTVPATLVGRDPDNDLAVIRVDPNATDQDGKPVRTLLRAVRLGDSDRVEIGEDAIAIGSPLGLQQTVTAGIVSAIRLPGEDTGQGQLDLLGGAVQTDAAINPGNSGGPLFNIAGDVIGVNTAILSQSGGNIGIGFAIPINVAKRVVPELISAGCYRHPLVGVSALSLSQMGPALKQQLGLATNLRGLLVQEANAGAAQAGLRAGQRVISVQGGQLRTGGDVITAIDGRPLASGGALRGYVENNKRPGEKVTLTILRDGQSQQLAVTLSPRQPAEGVTCRG